MRHNQRMFYAERIERAVKIIEHSVTRGDAPTLEELADVAAMSPYHFHRIYRIMTGEAVGETVRRIRLARSVSALAERRPIGDAAENSGYATSQAFARAFKAASGSSASEVRDQPALLDAILSDLRKPRRGAGGASSALDIEVISLEPFRVLAIRNVGDYAELNAGYERLFGLVLEQVEECELQGIYGIPLDDPRFTPASKCRFDCALATGEAGRSAGDLDDRQIAGGDYVRLRRVGNYDDLHEAIDLAYAYAVDVLDRAVANQPLVLHYLDDPEEIEDEQQLRADILLPLATGA